MDRQVRRPRDHGRPRHHRGDGDHRPGRGRHLLDRRHGRGERRDDGHGRQRQPVHADDHHRRGRGDHVDGQLRQGHRERDARPVGRHADAGAGRGRHVLGRRRARRGRLHGDGGQRQHVHADDGRRRVDGHLRRGHDGRDAGQLRRHGDDQAVRGRQLLAGRRDRRGRPHDHGGQRQHVPPDDGRRRVDGHVRRGHGFRLDRRNGPDDRRHAGRGRQLVGGAPADRRDRDADRGRQR